MLKKYKGIIIKVTLILAVFLSVLLYFKVSSIRGIVNIIIISFIISYGLKPIRDFIAEKARINRKKASLYLILFCLVSFLVLLYLMVPAIIEEGRNIGELLDSIENGVLKIGGKLGISNLPIFQTTFMQIKEKVNIFLQQGSNNFLDYLVDVMENIIALAVVPIISYYFLADGNIIYNKLLLIFSTDTRVIVRKINKNIDKVLSRYIMSQLILSLIVGALTFVLLIAAGVKLPLVLSVVNAVTNIIPYFGPILGGAPIIFIAFTESMTKGIIATVGVLVIQQIEGNFLSPKITGDSTDMHPIVIIILLIIGEKIGGAVGMVLCVPIAVIVKVIYEDINYYIF